MSGKLAVLDLFSGIGGFALGLERTGGFETVAFCEIEPFCRRVLAKHWPKVPCYHDIRTLTAERLRADGIAVDVICGGFPCQDISTAGRGEGIEGKRSGLWREYARLIEELRPLLVIIENVPALRTRGADRVLSDLEAVGYAGEPVVVGSVHAGALHRRQRAWIVARAGGERLHQQRRWWRGSSGTGEAVAHRNGAARSVADADGNGWNARRPSDATESAERRQPHRGCLDVPVAAADRQRLEIVFDREAGQCPTSVGSRRSRSVEPDVGRVAHGVPFRVDRLRALGNAVDPDIPELIGNAILATLATREAA